ncbi:MAG: glycosyl hydrolase 53 family protein [Parafilimonas sp.]|nr:glycosyl hydrolase 53 family protein [Parafilimonas sp.]
MQAIRFYFLLMLIASATFSSAQSFSRKINFDNNWKFAFGSANNPAKDFNYSVTTIFSKSGNAPGTAIDPKFYDSSWRKLNLPHDWVVELPFANSTSNDVESHGYKPVGGLFPVTSIGWYRKHFTIPASDSGHRFQIQFDGIFRDAMIWVNGFFLGNNKSGYIGCAYDITDFINFHGDNVITVRVDATQYEGWFYEGAGIYRHVWLNEYNNTHIATDGVFVFSSMQGHNAIVSVQSSIQNQTGPIDTCTLLSYITDRDGNIVGRSAPQKAVLGIGTYIIAQTLGVTNPKFWSVDDPYLYRAIVLVYNNNKVIDSEKVRFGIRTINATDSGLFINGVYTKIHGMCNHQDAAGVGSALPDYLQYYRIRLLKQMGVNAYRTSHNPPTPELLDACDSLGMLVLDENRLLNSSDEYISQFERLIKRDRTHPSVFMWSIGNEEFGIQTTSYGKRIAQTLLAKQKELDPTRTSTYAADVPNIFKGVNEVIPIRGFNYREPFVADYHRDHPLQPIIGTEMGSTVTTRGIYIKDTVNGYVPDEDTTHPWWSSTAETWWKLCVPNKYWLGGFVWTGFDYRGEPTPYSWPNINSHFGVLDVCGFPKNISYYYKSWWSDKDVLQVSPHWNWSSKEGQPIDVWVNSNADAIELFLNGKSLGKKDMQRNSHLQWSVSYEPGTLTAIGYRNGRKLIAQVETSDKPVNVVVTPYKTTMLADGKDVSVINISVVDKNGIEVPDANNLIHFSVTGDAKIIGVGNGDPSSHELDKFDDTIAQRHLFNGKCQVIVQSGTTRSFIHFEAKGDSIEWSGSTDISTIQPGAAHNVLKANKTFPITKFNATPVDKMLGADISFLPELEAKGIKFFDNGVEKDAIQILKDHGFNYVRLRIFVDPQNDSGYSPQKGFCDLAHTKEMAKRVKAAGMKFLLDFHYSDYWADPGHELKPKAWQGDNFTQLKQSVYDYTKMVMQQLKEQNTTPDMVQVGNEINHGMIWPDGYINNLDSLSQLIFAGINAVKAVSSSTSIMLHLALGGQNDEARFWLDNMIERGVQFDVIGLSYYPRWHGTLDDLQYNLDDLSKHYNKDVIVVEYSHKKQEVNQLAFDVPNGRGKGTCIWEPLSTWESFFDKDGKANKYLYMYDEISKEYLGK